ncbi:hypothetical protein CSUB01_12638 [Colletotrichum sublineola]|uniref:Uncharacterized protein n=1 Tax=Colletotrichum sublineola TaxID=1173701 RepID=A0A066X5K7_COLSU|nr:hypothetical protein CSUB01_12638 [Colletotrichum sublineola]
MAQRLILAIAPSLLRENHLLWLRDITQAYTQSATLLNRVILVRLPVEIRHLHDANAIMEMDTSTFDPCLLISAQNNEDFALIGMQTDDTIGLTDKLFSNREDTELTKATFTAKLKQFLEPGKPITFNGGVLSLDDNGDIHLR